ncbi:MAG: hypothetical protein HZY76_14850 [Anaerolineae bacterium]|nr:MAG: hypothetical protein HZY76_14850 [Anaerolineae bacterium]
MAGGSLYQDITALRPHSEKHDYFPQFERFRLSHKVEVEAGSRLHGSWVRTVSSTACTTRR